MTLSTPRLFCTYFDQRYLPRGLALYESLKTHCGKFRLWVLCLDDLTYQILNQLKLEAVTLVQLSQLEAEFPELLEIKGTRKQIEYYFTCTPCLPSYLFRHEVGEEWLTYLDADLYFFGEPEPVYSELVGKSIGIVPHRWTPDRIDMERFGVYNIGWLSFHGDRDGLACLNWYRERCIEWCYDYPEGERCGDQKYLDDWPSRFRGVAVIEHPGCNVASWNLEDDNVQRVGDAFFVVGRPVICFHFHGLTFPSRRAAEYRLQLAECHLRPGAPVRAMCEQYLRAVGGAERLLDSTAKRGRIAQPLRGTGLPRSLDG